jgi:WD40 repeat protein
VKVWRLRDWRLLESIKGHKQYVNTITSGSVSWMFSGSNDGSIRMLKRVEGKRKDYPVHHFVCALLSEETMVHALVYITMKDGSGQLFVGLEYIEGLARKNGLEISYDILLS